MKQVDTLLVNAHVLTMDESLNHYTGGAVAVHDGAIVAVGTESALRREYAAGETVDCGGKVLMPGLVNAHTHVPMTLLRGLADDLRLALDDGGACKRARLRRHQRQGQRGQGRHQRISWPPVTLIACPVM